jgi:crotonobetainyl-CoA:carnitine CoA-transferase CaiB-like acyl-CoA transferase
MSHHEKEQSWSEWIEKADSPASARTKPEALDHLMVLDCSHASMAGCFASSILAEFGAQVIRIEPLEGDPVRSYSPWGFMKEGTGLGYLNEGRNKFHVTLNLESSEGREIFRKLAAKADVIIETYLPGTMDEWGIGYRQLSIDNPKLIYCAMYTYGQFGPMAACGKADADVTTQAYSGITFVTGERPENPDSPKPSEVPTKEGNWMGWYAGGGWAAAAVLTALHYRVNSGKGQFIDVSPAEAYGRCINYSITNYQAFKDVVPRVGNWDAGVFPYTFFKCKDGYVFLAGFSDVNWKALCNIINRPDLQKTYPTIFERLDLKNMPIMYKELEKWTMAHTYDELYDIIMAYNKSGAGGVVVPARLSSAEEVMKNENFWIRGTFRKFTDPHYGEVVVANQGHKMTKSPPRVKWVCRPIGADNAHMYSLILGYGPKQLATMKEKGII